MFLIHPSSLNTQTLSPGQTAHVADDSWFSPNYHQLSYAWSNGKNYHPTNIKSLSKLKSALQLSSTIIDYHGLFDLGFQLNIENDFQFVLRTLGSLFSFFAIVLFHVGRHKT